MGHRGINWEGDSALTNSLPDLQEGEGNRGDSKVHRKWQLGLRVLQMPEKCARCKCFVQFFLLLVWVEEP